MEMNDGVLNFVECMVELLLGSNNMETITTLEKLFEEHYERQSDLEYQVYWRTILDHYREVVEERQQAE